MKAEYSISMSKEKQKREKSYSNRSYIFKGFWSALEIFSVKVVKKDRRQTERVGRRGRQGETIQQADVSAHNNACRQTG